MIIGLKIGCGCSKRFKPLSCSGLIDWLFRGGRLIILKSVIQSIPVYWVSIKKIPERNFEKNMQESISIPVVW
jgi:hypothetical protein